MNEEKEAIVFIPGFDAGVKNYYIDNFLMIGLTTRLERRRVFLEPDEIKIAGQSEGGSTSHLMILKKLLMFMKFSGTT